MAFALALVYLVLTYLSPANLFPSLAPFHIQLFIGSAALVGAVLVARMEGVRFEGPQLGLMVAFIAAIAISHLSHLWFSGAIAAMQDFLSSGIAFFILFATARTRERCRKVILAITFVGFYLLTRSVITYYAGTSEELYLMREVLSYSSETGEPLSWIDRIRSVGFLSDPNDFAQFLLVLVPFTCLAWKPRQIMRNLLCVIVPVSYLIYGILLTHSRGALIGLASLLFFALADRIGLVLRTAVLGCGLLGIMLANHGQRDISVHDESALGRLDAWGVGIGMLKEAPVFGTGYNTFLNYNELTAHNSYVLCFAELGLFGYFLWLALIISTCLLLNRVVEEEQKRDPALATLSNAIRLALVAYLTTSWFLSRTYVPTLYVLLGLALGLAATKESSSDELSLRRFNWRSLTALAEVASIAAVYVFTRMRGI